MGTSNNDALFNYEYDFKEQHTKHLKRPALVAIKKPLLSKNEMEDVLIRLLNLHVPAILDEQASQSGIGRRAFLVDNAHYIQRSNKSGENESFIQRGIFEINHKNNIYISPIVTDNSIENVLSYWISPDALGTDYRHGEQLNFFSYSSTDAASSNPDYRDTRMFRAGDPGYVIAQTTYDKNVTQITSERNAIVYKSFNPYFSTNTGEFTYLPNSNKGAVVKFDLFLLNKTDHNRLACDNTTRITTLQSILDNAYLFDKNGLPQFKGYHEIYNPDDPKGISHIMDDSAVKRAFGYIPNTIKKAYHWEFYCPTTTRVAILNESYAKQQTKEQIEKAFSELVSVLVTLYDGFTGNKDSMQMQGLRNWVHLFDNPGKSAEGDAPKLDVKAFSNNELNRKKYINGVTAFLSALPDADPPKEYKNDSYIMKDMSASINTKRLKSTKKLMKAAIESYLSGDKITINLLGDFDDTYRNELAEAKEAALRRKYIKPKKACDITIGKFKVEYYAILLKKVMERYNKFKYFIETTKTLELVNKDIYESLVTLLKSKELTTESDDKQKPLSQVEIDFITQSEKFFYSPFSGFYITSYSETKKEVLSPYWNSTATTDMLSTGTNDIVLDAASKDILINNQNKDVSSISIDRVTSGMSIASLVIKNDKEKYNYEQSDVLNRANFIIEPMDEIAIYLPTTQTETIGGVITNNDKLRIAFSGVISKVSSRNNAGMHSISISAECYKKYLKINRTNTRPSATRAESGNKMVQAFDMPYEFYNTIENWMTYMFTTSLTTFGSELSNSTDYDKNLFSVNAKPIKEQVSHTVVKTDDVFRKETQVEQVTIASNFTVSGVQVYPQEIMNKTTKKNVVTYEYEPGVIKDISRTVTVGKYQQVEFVDPLLTYLWYKVNSINFPKEEQLIIETNLKTVMESYVYTIVVEKSKQKLTPIPGCQDFKMYLQQGKRASYFVFKTRNAPDSVCVAKIVGTSQPSYKLKTANWDIQFSSWKTNNDIIQEIANKFNFLYYTDKDGIILFTPYNFDLTTLNTENNTSSIDTDKMLVYRSKRDIQNDDNVQILKDQYIVNFTNTDNDKELINWLTLTGNWQVDQTQAVDQFTKALVKDPVLITRFGYRPAKNVSILGIQDAQALKLYGLAYMDRKNKRYRSATASVIFDSRMDVNLPYYVPSDEVIYFCEGMRIQYNAGETCVVDMNLSYGKKPLIALEPYTEDVTFERSGILGTKALSFIKSGESTDNLTLLQKLDKLFLQDNAIKPSTWAQYRKLFNTNFGSKANTKLDNMLKNITTVVFTNASPLKQEVSTQEKEEDAKESVNASICCFNGLLWDNVAGISFEELKYDYGWLTAGCGIGITTAVGASGKFMEPISSADSLLSFSNLSTETKNVLNMFFIDVPSINPSEVPPQLDTRYYLYDDLRVDGILDPDLLKDSPNTANK